MSEGVSETQIIMSPESINHVGVMRAWAMFLAIVGFIGAGFTVLMGFFFSFIMPFITRREEMGPVPSMLIGLFYVVLGVLYFFPPFYLFKFSANAKAAIATNSSESMTESLKNLRTVFVLMGVLTIVVFVLVVLAIIAGILMGIMHTASMSH